MRKDEHDMNGDDVIAVLAGVVACVLTFVLVVQPKVEQPPKKTSKQELQDCIDALVAAEKYEKADRLLKLMREEFPE